MKSLKMAFFRSRANATIVLAVPKGAQGSLGLNALQQQ